MLIEYKKANVLTATYAISERQCGSVRFMPGVNDISRKDWEKVKDLPKVKELMQEEVISLVLKEEPEAGGESGILDLKPQEAAAVIKKTFDLEVLEDWKSKDSRKAVLKSLDHQIKYVDDQGVKKKD